jgi:hypothetical protein
VGSDYSLSNKGIEESLSDFYVALIQAEIANLNTLFAGIGTVPVVLTSGQVVLGDAETLSQSRISVIAGGEEDVTTALPGTPWTLPQTTTSGYREEIRRNIIFYLHPDELHETDADLQESEQERVLLVWQDHMRRRVFHDPANISFRIASVEHDSAGDTVDTSHIESIKKSMTPKNFSNGIMVSYSQLSLVAFLA